MSLSSLYTELHRAAARTGQDRALDLSHGARIAVRVRDGETTLTISRKLKPVGDTELITFKRACNVPEHATRYPVEGQGTKEHDGISYRYISFRWKDSTDGT